MKSSIFGMTLMLMMLIAISGCTSSNYPVNNLDETPNQPAEKIFSIINVSSASSSVTLRNTGTVPIPLSEITIYVDDVLQTKGLWNGENILQPGAIAIYDWSSSVCNAGSRVKVMTASKTDSIACPPITDTVVVNKKIVIDSYTKNSVSVRNVGNLTIQASELSVYVNGKLRICDWDSAVMPSYSLRRCSFRGGDCMGGNQINVVSPGNSDQITC